MTATETKVSKYCKECVSFIKKRCEGKAHSSKVKIRWGTNIGAQHLSGTHFCKLYEFDERLYSFTKDHNEIGKMKTIRKRQVKKDEETSAKSHSDMVDSSETLNSADLENLID